MLVNFFLNIDAGVLQSVAKMHCFVFLFCHSYINGNINIAYKSKAHMYKNKNNKTLNLGFENKSPGLSYWEYSLCRKK